MNMGKGSVFIINTPPSTKRIQWNDDGFTTTREKVFLSFDELLLL